MCVVTVEKSKNLQFRKKFLICEICWSTVFKLSLLYVILIYSVVHLKTIQDGSEPNSQASTLRR